MLEKFIKTDKNEELEKILEEKNIEEHAKNLLQGILYKIEVSYKDYKKVKVTDITKSKYIEELLNNISRKCIQIKTVKLSEKVEDDQIRKELEKNNYYIANNEIISYPIERKILYAIEQNSNNKKIVNNRYGIASQTISNLINTGKSIDRVEVFRDFNGWSWTTINTELEDITANLVYQTLRILFGEEFLNGWTQDTDGIIDYIELMKKDVSNEFIEKLAQIAIIDGTEKSENLKSELLEKLKEVETKLTEFKNTQETLTQITKLKKEKAEEIRNIEKILSQESRLKQEYDKRNENLPIQEKIFSIKVLKKQLNERKQQLLNEIEECNYILKPKNYLNEKAKLESEKQLLEVVDFSKEQKETLIIEFEQLFLTFWEKRIKNIEQLEEIVKLIYKLRYFELLPFNEKKSIKDVKELQKSLTQIEKKVFDKAVEKKVIVNMPFEIMQHLFKTRIMILEELYFKITNEMEKYYVQIFDENITEERFEIKSKDNIKINKKIKIFI